MKILKKWKSEKAFTGVDAAVAVVIVTLLITLVSTVTYNTYTQLLATHKNAMATFYAVQILEEAEKLSYKDSALQNGTYTTDNTNSSILGIEISENYTAILSVQDYNQIAGNEDKLDIIKILTVSILYNESGIYKNITIKTLKLNQ